MPSVHAQRLERWIGAELAEGIARQSRGWHGPPIPIMGVPGRVFVRGDGDYVGFIRGGGFASLSDFARDRARHVLRRWARGQLVMAGMGFASLSDLISEATTGGKGQLLYYNKTTVAKPAAAYCQDMWNKGAVPAAGSNGGAAPGGTVYTNASAGALPFISPGGSDTAHLTTWNALGTIVGALLLYDRLFAVSVSHNSANVAITGVPTRYQGGALPDLPAAGSFISARVTTVLDATAHNVTITYVDQDGNTAEAGAALAARVSSAVDTIPFTTPRWFYTLNGADMGVRKVTNWATSGANAGVSDLFLGHILAICPMLAANLPFILDGINSAFNLVQIQTAACLAFMEYFMPATTLGTFSGLIEVVSG
jgi:hypothetical protein